MDKLSIFIDESGDFDLKSKHSPYYIYTLVFHNQALDIAGKVAMSDQFLVDAKYGQHAIHTMPLIRGEGLYRRLDRDLRIRLFNHMYKLTMVLPIKYKSFVYFKGQFSSLDKLKLRMVRDLSFFIKDVFLDICQYDLATIYYDLGQSEIKHLIEEVLFDEISNTSLKIIDPSDYKIFQVADFICAMELLRVKMLLSKINKSERDFFISEKKLKDNYLNKLRKKSY